MSKWIVIIHWLMRRHAIFVYYGFAASFSFPIIEYCELQKMFRSVFQPSWPSQVRWKFPLLHACDCMCLKLFIQEYTLVMYCNHLSGFESPAFASTTTNRSWQAMPVLKRSDRDMLCLIQKLRREDEQIMR